MRSEFEFINQMKSKYGLDRIGDDCAVLPKDDKTDQVITADMLVEDIDFMLEWTKPEFLGHKTLAVSLSDIAAMGAEPKFALLSIGVAENLWKTDFLDRFYASWHELAREYSVELVGGDISKAEKLVFDSIVIGEVPKGQAILRSGAKPGNGVYITGTLGGAAGGLELLLSGRENCGDLVEKQLRPTPEVIFAKQLQSLGLCTAMIDVSDGLSSDLHHLCESSRVGAKIYAQLLPINSYLATCFDPATALEMALHGGEDLGLLFTADPAAIGIAGLPEITRIGEITDQPGVIEISDGSTVSRLEPRGFRHF